MNDFLGLFWLVVLLLGNAFFVAAEFAVMSARRSQIEPLADAGNKRAKTALKAMESVSLMLAVCQLGITVCSLLILNVAEPAIHHLLAAPLHLLGVPEALAGTLAFVLALLIVTFLHVTFGEMVPKNISVSMADKAVMLLATPLMWLSKAVYPVVVSLNWMANGFLLMLGVQPKDEVNSSFTRQEVATIVAESTRSGLVEDDSGLLSGALEFSQYTAEMTMVPLEELVTLPLGTTVAQFEKAVSRTGFSRFVMEGPDGKLAGYLHMKDVMNLPDSRYHDPISVSKLRALGNMRAAEEIEDALVVMQRNGSHLSRVISPDGVTLGVLFLEDVLEQLVGEIRDATQSQGLRRQNESGDNENDSHLS